MGIFDKFRQILNPVDVRLIELAFEMDVDSSGQHRVRISRKNQNGILKEFEVNRLLSYGFQENVVEKNRHVIYVLSEEDQHTLLALRSLNPVVQDDGNLVFDVEPPVLRYLRKKKVSESEASKTVEILDTPAKPVAKISFDPKSGVKVETGYSVPGLDGLISPDQIKRTRDGKHTRIGNLFVPIAEVSDKAREFLEKKQVFVSLRDIPEFFQRDLVMMKNEFNAVLTDLTNQVRIISKPMEPYVRVKKDPQGWLDFNVQYNADGFVLPYELVAKARREGEKYVRIDDQTWIEVDNKTIDNTEKKMKELDTILTEKGYRLPVSEFASLEEFIESIGGRASLDEAYKKFLEQLSGFNPDPAFQLSSNFEQHLISRNLILRPYQRAGIHWLSWLRNNHLHGVLADDMGLGKTIQSLSVVRSGYEDSEIKQHTLVIAPKSVLHHWEREIHRVFTYARTYIYHGPNRSQKFFKSSLPYIFITTYDTVVRDNEVLSKIPLFYLILDEATRIKNPDAQRSQAIKSLNAVHRLALSGTPVENRPSELWSLFDFLMRGHLGKLGTFQRIFESTILDGNTVASQRLGRRIKPFLLRRKKEEVARDLPEKIVMTEWVSLSAEQRRLYGSLQTQMKSLRAALQHGQTVSYAGSILPVLTKLKQICDHPALVTGETQPVLGRSEKFDEMVEKIEEIVEDNQYVVVFSHFLQMLSLFEMVLKEKGITYIRIDGSTNNRQTLIDSFNNHQRQVALLSIMAAGYGINLTGANHVIHADRWWNPAVEDQATDRVHRIGQEKTVYVYHVLTEGTLEEKIDRLLTSKRGIADQIIGAASQGEYRWTREELLELLKPLD